jgi:hypothetical protein
MLLLALTLISRVNAHSSPMLDSYRILQQADFGISRYGMVNDVTFSRDAATFHLVSGTIYFFEPDTIMGKETVTGALFMGEGTFQLSAPTEFEFKQLKRFYNTELSNNKSYRQPFRVLFLRFADTTYQEIARVVHLLENGVPDEVKHEAAYCRKYLSGQKDALTFYLLSSLVSSTPDKHFYAHLYQHRAKSVFFAYNPSAREEVSFHNRESEINYNTQTICSFHKKEDYDMNTDLLEEAKDQITVDRYRIESTIDAHGVYAVRAQLFFQTESDDFSLLALALDKELKVQDVRDERDSALAFVTTDESGFFIVSFPQPLSKGTQTHITVRYASDEFLIRKWDCFYPPSTKFWYPLYSSAQRSEFELRFRIPSGYDCISIGERTLDSTGTQTRTIHWHQEQPIEYPHFLIGKLRFEKHMAHGDIPVTVAYTHKSHAEIVQSMKNRNVPLPHHLEKRIAVDAANCIKLFTHVFGDYPLNKLDIIQVPDDRTLSVPGLVLLPWYRFQFLTDLGGAEMVRAHEIAHQWWGNAVACKTYHDIWLSEGFATYAGIWYLQWVTEDNELYFRNLERWKNEIVNYRKFCKKNGTEPGPIYLGSLLKIPDTESEYALFVYLKAAYVIHMLRNMMIDLNTMDEDAFIALLREFYHTYEGQAASTEDFRVLLEKHIGEDMDWFFDQWIYGTAIPIYHVSYRAFDQPDGSYIMKIHVQQEGVQEHFKMYVPVTVIHKDGRCSTFRLTIDEPREEFSITCPFKPDKLTFNAFHSVLAEVKYEKFREKQ